jgi:hypothetical protein
MEEPFGLSAQSDPTPDFTFPLQREFDGRAAGNPFNFEPQATRISWISACEFSERPSLAKQKV